MDTFDVIRDQLSRNNPFSSGTAAAPWENQDPDVASLNQAAYGNICRLIQAKNQNPRISMAGLVLGDSGMGKTHFLKRLLDYTRQNDISAAFVSVKPLLNPQKPMRHLLREIAVNLARVRVSDRSSPGKHPQIPQFEYFVTKILQRYREDHVGFNFESTGKDYFKNRYPDLSESLLKAVSDYRDKKKRSLILRWLQGCVDQDCTDVLKLPDRSSMNDYELEEEAHDLILSMGLLLEYCSMPMILCFDQLDGMKDTGVLQAFGDMIHFLVNDVSSILPLAFVRIGTWDQRFVPHLDQAVIQRLKNNVERLQGCSVVQAQELLKIRVERRFPDDAGEKYQWLMTRLENKLKEGYPPRQVIELANDVIRHPEKQGPAVPEEADVVKFFADEYRRERSKVAADFDVWPPDTERLSRALRAWLQSRPEYGELAAGPDKFVTLAGKVRIEENLEAPCAFIINTAEHPKTVEAAFRRGVSFLEKNPDGRCYYIMDQRCVFKDRTRWKKVHEVKDDFDARRGLTLFLDHSRAIDWYGLTSLIFKLEAGDILLPPAFGFRPATEEEFSLYMKKDFNKNFLEIPPVEAPITNPPAVTPPDMPLGKTGLEKKIISILKKSSMQFMTVTILLGQLVKSGDQITYDLLLEFISKRDERFRLYESTDDRLVMLK
ncbi:MAG: hypothetical protein LBR61_07540 [Synergistaceae bacterium]|jgi:hypothetical protein|nr:hypothetical protein [Synergistaceae bacterium]